MSILRASFGLIAVALLGTSLPKPAWAQDRPIIPRDLQHNLGRMIDPAQHDKPDDNAHRDDRQKYGNNERLHRDGESNR